MFFKHTWKGSGTMRKLSVLFLSLVMLLACAVSVSAESVSANSANGIFWPGGRNTSAVSAEFYVQRFGAQMDKQGNVSTRDTSYFTSVLYKSELTPGRRSTSYSIVYQDGIVSSDDVIAEVVDKPKDADILAAIKGIYESEEGKLLSNNGRAVNWDKFTTDNYYIRWYVLKYVSGFGSSSSCWHIDGVVVEQETDLPVEITVPSDPGYEDIMPAEPSTEEQPPEEDYGEAYEYTSNFAYIYGYDDSTMAADDNLLRSEVSAMVHRLVKQNDKLGGFVYNEANEPAFDDIEGEWSRSGIEYVGYKGAFTQGGSVYPYADVTRGETFKIICLGLDFTDKTDLSYDDYAAILYKAGYIQGDEKGDLNIGNLITRAEFCTIYNKIIGREHARLVTADGTDITAETYGFTDLDESAWYYETMLRATSAYDDGYVDIELRNQRNVLDDYR